MGAVLDDCVSRMYLGEAMKGQTHGGKGSGRRRSLVSQEQVDKNWEALKRNNEKAKQRANQDEKTAS